MKHTAATKEAGAVLVQDMFEEARKLRKRIIDLETHAGNLIKALDRDAPLGQLSYAIEKLRAEILKQ